MDRQESFNRKNFGSKELQEDNLIEQWKLKGRKLIFFGDDTWLKLFPNHFVRSDGTTSFFVSDYTEVDDNVTRHLEPELHNKDWDVMILHYLGLDHIGHVTGPDGPEIPEKLAEMSEILKIIHDKIIQKPWKNDLPPLVLVLGDHGMADQGGHGGSSTSEIMTPLVFLTHSALNLKAQRKSIKQYDLVPNLAYLTGVPIPKNSLGSMIFQVDENLEKYNRKQIAQVINAQEPLENLEDAIEEFEKKMVEYNLSFMTLGILISFVTCALSFEKEFLTQKFNYFCVLHILSFNSTSFIEEEYLTMYYIGSTVILLKILNSRKDLKSGFIALFILRIAQTLNQVPHSVNESLKIDHWNAQRNLLPAHTKDFFVQPGGRFLGSRSNCEQNTRKIL